MNSEAEALLERIKEAFQNVPRGGLSIHQAHIIKWADDKRVAEARLLDRDRCWMEISDATIQEASKALYGADPISWRYFIPAYMSWTVRHCQDSALFITDQTIYAFQPHEVGDALRQDWILRVETLSQIQKRCVCEFLRYMAKQPLYCDAENASKSLSDYWSEFCTD